MKKKYIFISFGILAVSFIAYCFFPVIFFSTDYEKQPGNILIYDRNGKVITDKAGENGYYKFIKISSDTKLIQAIIQIEDQNYFSHYGIDIFSKLGALKTNIFSGRIVSGGSTITEQYIKNRFFPGNKRTYIQKAREAILAFYYSLPMLPATLGSGKNREYLKEKVLNLYAHKLYLGNNNYGIGSAIEVYFDKNNIENLTEEEITTLISLIKYPGIKSLEEKHFRKYFDKVKKKLGYSFERKIFTLNKKENIETLPWVNNQSLNNRSPQLFSHEGEESNSTIDLELQLYVKQVMNQTLQELADKNVTNAAVFAINPKTRETLVYQASRDFYSQDIDGEFDVIKAKRQMGSTLKPFLYLLALESGATTESFLLDIEQEYNSFQKGKSYTSNNYNLKNYGLVRLKKALGNSLNNASVRLSKELGLQKVFTWYETYGFNFNQHPEYYGYSFVLGSPNISLEDLVYSYGNLLPELNPPIPSPFPQGEKGDMTLEGNKFLLYDILSDPDNRDLSFGVNSILNTSIPMAVKTGTSSNFRDNVVISYHPDLVIGVWVGNNDNSSMIGVTGITGAGYIWHQIAEKAIALGYITDNKLSQPDSILESEYCLDINCFRKEIIFSQNNHQYYSAISDNLYSSKDMFIRLTNNEKEILENMGFILEE